LPVLPSQKLKIERLFLRFCSLRTNKYKPNLSVKQGSYHVPIPYRKKDVEEKINIQRAGSKVKPYQVRQVREVILKYHLAGES